LIFRLEVLVRQLQILNDSISTLEVRIEKLASSFAGYVFFRALPGAGATFAARLPAAYGEERSRWTSATNEKDPLIPAPRTTHRSLLHIEFGARQHRLRSDISHVERLALPIAKPCHSQIENRRAEN
jgi:hypothetical protein